MGNVGPLIAIFIIASVLLIALKFGVIGGGGVGANRADNPYLFWFIFAVFATFGIAAIIILIMINS